MNTYIANFIDSSCTSFELYSYNNGLISSEHFLDIAELKNLDDSSQVVVLIPSIMNSSKALTIFAIASSLVWATVITLAIIES